MRKFGLLLDDNRGVGAECNTPSGERLTSFPDFRFRDCAQSNLLCRTEWSYRWKFNFCLLQ